MKINVLVLLTSLYRGKMWPRDPKFGSLYRGFRYNGVRYIGDFTHTYYKILPVPNKYFAITGTSLHQGSLYLGFTVRRKLKSIVSSDDDGVDDDDNGNDGDDDDDSDDADDGDDDDGDDDDADDGDDDGDSDA